MRRRDATDVISDAAAPLLVTALLEPDAQDCFDSLRRQHFPPALNKIPAHVTLFHALPAARLAEITADLETECAPRAPMELTTAGLRFLGRGVAIVIEGPAFVSLRAALAARWQPSLSPQDRETFRPHVTIQNKVAPAVARALHATLAETFETRTFRADGLRLWRYLGGPWALQADVLFRTSIESGY